MHTHRPPPANSHKRPRRILAAVLLASLALPVMTSGTALAQTNQTAQATQAAPSPLAAPTPASPRPDAIAQCPDAMSQIQELLASASRAIGDDGEVHARFEVDRAGRVQAVTVDGHRRYALRTRLALESLSCRGGVPQGYRLTIRFAPEAPGRDRSQGVVALLERAP